MFHAFEAYVNREVATASAAIPFLNIAETVVSLSISHNIVRPTVNAGISRNRFDNGRLNDGSQLEAELDCPDVFAFDFSIVEVWACAYPSNRERLGAGYIIHPLTILGSYLVEAFVQANNLVRCLSYCQAS